MPLSLFSQALVFIYLFFLLVLQHTSFDVRNGNIDLIFEVRSLVELQEYEFWVTASTVVGEGEVTEKITQSPNSRGL